uniref:Transcription factor bHLH96 n=1 Tax=Anthurium amnicola TaxID=1678845 RepID=A0A1D1Y8K2_9ARAE
MTLEALASSEFTSFVVYDTISATNPHLYPNPTQQTAAFFSTDSEVLKTAGGLQVPAALVDPAAEPQPGLPSSSSTARAEAAPAPGRKKRRRRPRSCKNKEEAESQRMTHIAVERNRRRQMNEHLAVLRSLMPDSYIQRGDQASIVAGAIDFVKELEQLLQSLEAQKRTLQQQLLLLQGSGRAPPGGGDEGGVDGDLAGAPPPFAQFFAYPQYMWCQGRREQCSPQATSPAPAGGAVADIEVTLVESFANMRILSQRRPGQLMRMVAGFQSLLLTVLHLNVTTMDTVVLYSVSAKVEEGCNLTSVDDIAAAVHHMLSLIEAEAALS